MRLYGADPAIIKALAGTGVGIVIGAANGDVPSLASDPNVATQWINANVLPFYPASKIILITVGNEVRKIQSKFLPLEIFQRKFPNFPPIIAGADVEGPKFSESATPGNAKCSKSSRGGVARREN